jgi:membrane protein YdbS with pleckstrin-like domain
LDAFRPAAGYLRFLKLWFWLGVVLCDGLIVFVWVAISAASRSWGMILALPALALAILPAVVVYIAIHLQFDTTWYVMTGRSLRIRRGIWTIHETTITFENVQNVEVNQGPVQRLFGIADVRVDTAGGGGRPAGHEGQAGMNTHRGLIEGVSNASQIRDLILSRLRRSRSAGLGDEHPAIRGSLPQWSAAHVAVLRDIRGLAQSLASTV